MDAFHDLVVDLIQYSRYCRKESRFKSLDVIDKLEWVTGIVPMSHPSVNRDQEYALLHDMRIW